MFCPERIPSLSFTPVAAGVIFFYSFSDSTLILDPAHQTQG